MELARVAEQERRIVKVYFSRLSERLRGNSMSDRLLETMNRLMPSLRAGDLDACERAVTAQMQSLPHSPFHIAIDVAISNDPLDAARHFDRFFHSETLRIKTAAAYTEMNGFYINPKLWFCDLFAYTTYGGHGDYDWLAH